MVVNQVEGVDIVVTVSVVVPSEDVHDVTDCRQPRNKYTNGTYACKD